MNSKQNYTNPRFQNTTLTSLKNKIKLSDLIFCYKVLNGLIEAPNIIKWLKFHVLTKPTRPQQPYQNPAEHKDPLSTESLSKKTNYKKN